MATLLRELEITAVFVTHDQEEAFVVGDHVAVMFEGSVVQVGHHESSTSDRNRPGSPDLWGEANVLAGVGSGLEVANRHGDAHFGPTRLRVPCQVVVRPEFIRSPWATWVRSSSSSFTGTTRPYRISVDGVSVSARAMSLPGFSVGDSVALSHDGPDVVAYPRCRIVTNCLVHVVLGFPYSIHLA